MNNWEEHEIINPSEDFPKIFLDSNGMLEELLEQSKSTENNSDLTMELEFLDELLGKDTEANTQSTNFHNNNNQEIYFHSEQLSSTSGNTFIKPTIENLQFAELRTAMTDTESNTHTQDIDYNNQGECYIAQNHDNQNQQYTQDFDHNNQGDCFILAQNYDNQNQQYAPTATNEIEAEFTILEQPESCFRFRYISDTKSTHGVLFSENMISKDKKKYPSVLLQLNTSIQSDLVCTCSLYEPNDGENYACPRLSPHILVKKEQRRGSGRKNSQKVHIREICHGPIICDDENATHITSSSNTNKYEFKLKDCYILCIKNENKRETLRRKYEELKKWETQQSQLNEIELNEIAENVASECNHNPNIECSKKTEIERVALGFTIFTKSNNQYNYFMGPIFSNAIANLEKFKIHHLCNSSGSINGGESITVLVKDTKKCVQKDIEIHLYEIDKEAIIWEAKPTVKEIFKTCAITFELPKYTGPSLNSGKKQIDCLLKLTRKTDGSISTPITFIYRNNTVTAITSANAKKRRLDENLTTADISREREVIQPQEQQVSSSVVVTETLKADSINLTSLSCHMKQIHRSNIAPKSRPLYTAIQRIRSIVNSNARNHAKAAFEIQKLNEAYVQEHAHNGNTIFHDAIASGDFIILYKLFKSSELRTLLQEAINDQDETLLHYACLLNKSDYIRSLIGIGCAIYAQDSEQLNTPLHMAIECEQQMCIKKFGDIFQKPNAYEQARDELQQLLYIYNGQGYTVLHLAVLKDQRELVGDILQFAKCENINVCTIEVLGNGNTLLHLAVAAGLIDMAKLIITHIPDAYYYENYAGESISDMLDDSTSLESESDSQKKCLNELITLMANTSI